MISQSLVCLYGSAIRHYQKFKSKQSGMFPRSNGEPVGVDTLVLFSEEKGEGRV